MQLAQTTATKPSSDLSRLWNKVPEITLFFWIIKILATTVGETVADFLNVRLGLGLSITSLIMAGLLVVCLVYQVRLRRYVPWVYWLAVVLISVVGTLISDNLVDNLGVTLETTTIVFSVALVVTFAIWYYVERTLAMHSIRTRRRELFYWAAILFTFALGTSGGDLATEGLNLGYGEGVLIFGALIAVTAVAYYALGMNAVLSFWIAYILTRPLGASSGDLLSQSKADGGLGLGTTVTSAIFLVTIVGLVVFLTQRQRQEPEPTAT